MLNSLKNSWNFVYILPFILTRFSLLQNWKFEFYFRKKKIHWKIRETLFTFYLSFWRVFLRNKIENSNFIFEKINHWKIREILFTFYFSFSRDFLHIRIENSNFIFEKKNHKKIRGTLFTFKLLSAEFLSFWRDFLHNKIEKFEFYFRKKIIEKFVKLCLHF